MVECTFGIMAKKQRIFDRQSEKKNRTVVTKSLKCAT